MTLNKSWYENRTMKVTFVPHAEGLQVSIRYSHYDNHLAYEGLVLDRSSEVTSLKRICSSIGRGLTEVTEWGEYDSRLAQRIKRIGGLS